MAARHRFEARLERFGTQYGVTVPAAVSRAAGVRGRVPVVVRVAGGEPFRATFVPAGGGRHRLHLSARVRGAAGAAVGDRVAVEAREDWAPRAVAIPADLRRALDDEGVLETWDAMPAGKREHIVQWIDEAARETTREKRIARALEVTLARREKQADRRGVL
jgi:hypothetical protein